MKLVSRQLRLVLSVLTIAYALSAFSMPVFAQSNPCSGSAFPGCPATSEQCQPCNGICIPETYLCLMEPFPGMPSYIPPATSATALGPFLYYVNNGVWQWAFRIGVAVAIANAVYGGLAIAQSNGDSGKIDAGKQRFMWSGIGLAILLLAGVLLNTINPIGFLVP